MTERAPWTPERLRENAARQLAEMLVISDELDEAARPEGWTHIAGPFYETAEGFAILIWSKRTGLWYEVTPTSCFCRHWVAVHQRCPELVPDKHQLWAYPGGIPRADWPIRWLPAPEEMPAREQAAAASLEATFR